MDIKSYCLATQTISERKMKTRPGMERWNNTSVSDAVYKESEGHGYWNFIERSSSTE